MGIQGLAALALAHEIGINIGLGTDLLGGMHKDQSNEFTIRAQVMPALDVLRSATSRNARLLNRQGELGMVASSTLADLIVVDGNPLLDISCLDCQGEALALIFKGGSIFKNGLACILASMVILHVPCGARLPSRGSVAYPMRTRSNY